MKDCTDKKQSKKLTEILPVKTADIHKDKSQPQWSLTSLLCVLPQIDEWHIPFGYTNEHLYRFEPKLCKVWDMSLIPDYKVVYEGLYETNTYDNPIDACVEMIIKLHEEGILLK